MNVRMKRSVGSLVPTAALFTFCLLTTGCRPAEPQAVVEDVRAQAQKHLEQAAARVTQLVGVATNVKRELDKVYKTTTRYDLAISEDEGDAKVAAHQAALAKMNRVVVKDVTVGYEQRSDLTVNGTAYARHFRASWTTDGKVVGVSYYSQKEMDAEAFVRLLDKLVPIVGEKLTRNVSFHRGEK